MTPLRECLQRHSRRQREQVRQGEYVGKDDVQQPVVAQPGQRLRRQGFPLNGKKAAQGDRMTARLSQVRRERLQQPRLRKPRDGLTQALSLRRTWVIAITPQVSLSRTNRIGRCPVQAANSGSVNSGGRGDADVSVGLIFFRVMVTSEIRPIAR